MEQDFKCRMLSWEDAYGMAKNVAGMIVKEGYRPDCIIAIARGGLVPSMMLSDLLGVADLFSIRVEHWGKTGTKDKKAIVKYPLNADLSNKKVLLVDDLTDTGDSMLLALEDAKKHDPGDVKTATLIHKMQSRYRPDYYAIETDKWRWVIFPWNIKEDLTNLVGKVTQGKKMSAGEVRKRLKDRCDLTVGSGMITEVIRELDGKLI